MRKCPECQKEKMDGEFYKKLKGLSYRCKVCTDILHKQPEFAEKRRIREQKWRDENRQLHRDRRRTIRLNNFQNTLLRSIRNRAKQDNMDFNLEKHDIKLLKQCPILGIDIIICDSMKEQSISVDRIDNNKGYIKDNIVCISNRANKLKKDATLEELWLVYNKYKKLKEDKEDWYEV